MTQSDSHYYVIRIRPPSDTGLRLQYLCKVLRTVGLKWCCGATSTETAHHFKSRKMAKHRAKTLLTIKDRLSCGYQWDILRILKPEVVESSDESPLTSLARCAE